MTANTRPVKDGIILCDRWKRDDKGEPETDGNGKKKLQFIAIQRQDNKEWAIPGVSNDGMTESFIVTKSYT